MTDEHTQQNDSAAAGQPAPRKPRRWLRIALIASLALNVLFIGFAASSAYHFSGKHWRGQAPVAQVMRQGRKFIHDMPRERRRELWAMIKQRRGEFAVNADELRTAVQALAEALKQEPFDTGRTEQALMQLQGQAQSMLDRGRGVTLEVISALSQSEREDFARRLLSTNE